MKNHSRVFIMLGGKSCLPENIFEFLKKEYVIGVSQWCLLHEKFPFDFYYINDARSMYEATIDKKNFFTFLETDKPSWFKYLVADESWNALPFREFYNKKYKLGGHKYDSVEPPWKNAVDPPRYDIFEDRVENIPPKSSNRIPNHFSDSYYKKIKIERTGTGNGGALRCAIDLAYYLQFKQCYLLNIDTFPYPGPIYNEHITSVYDNNKPHFSTGDWGSEGRLGFTLDELKNGKYKPELSHNSVAQYPKYMWNRRFSFFKDRDFSISRLVSRESYSYEQDIICGKYKMDKRLIEQNIDKNKMWNTKIFEDEIGQAS